MKEVVIVDDERKQQDLHVNHWRETMKRDVEGFLGTSRSLGCVVNSGRRHKDYKRQRMRKQQSYIDGLRDGETLPNCQRLLGNFYCIYHSSLPHVLRYC